MIIRNAPLQGGAEIEYHTPRRPPERRLTLAYWRAHRRLQHTGRQRPAEGRFPIPAVREVYDALAKMHDLRGCNDIAGPWFSRRRVGGAELQRRMENGSVAQQLRPAAGAGFHVPQSHPAQLALENRDHAI